MVRFCLTRDPHNFPDCRDDPRARALSAPADETEGIAFTALPTGDYALAVMHDENGNARLDTFAKVPREGFGFSRNPAIRFGPPSFAKARFAVAAGDNRQDVRIKYIL